ncbi:hypothetical protein GCM10011504_53450 [Siccirubricoccus deserti]|uniref:Lipoprotein n=1 Tax=Siccirubricoccus deserti TaxID=2013562 RepID=A0A9X0R3I0_9PROT|nr:hypothetical protein [Siccirubricoccus deserti]MBC4018799.1 hypothetical protein [Siccirubricoccus deserti]GGC68857.1 hypothetical protein GCM10011504_53450 [Siccirubricoccus deserti]
MKNFLAVSSLVVLLGGCGLIAALDQMDREADQRACDGFGFRRRTDAYSNCMMQQAAQREAEDQRAQRARDREAFERVRRR